MKSTTAEKKKATELLIEYLSEAPGRKRNEIMEGVLKKHGFSPEEIAASLPSSSPINVVRSLVGSALNELTANGQAVTDGKSGRYSLAREKLVIVKEAECRTELLHALKGKSLNRQQLYRALQKKFGTDKTASPADDNTLKLLAGQILAEEKQAGRIIDRDGLCSLASSFDASAYPSVPMPEEAFEPVFLSRINDMGGAFFEHFVCNMLEKYYLMTGREVLSCGVTGGSEDGGIDVYFETRERLGFVERVLIQTKNRRTAPVTEKEVREFYGAMNARSGTRGIYITTSSFHPGAEKFLDSIPDCVGIDGRKLFSLIKQTSYGVHKTQNGYTFDNVIFS